MTQTALNSRALIGADLYREGRITRPECFRLEMDAALGRDTGPIRYEANNDYAEWREEYPELAAADPMKLA